MEDSNSVYYTNLKNFYFFLFHHLTFHQYFKFSKDDKNIFIFLYLRSGKSQVNSKTSKFLFLNNEELILIRILKELAK